MKKTIRFLFSAEGRIGRDEFWSFHIAMLMLFFVLNFVIFLAGEDSEIVKYPLIGFAILIPWSFFCVYAKRFHDLGKSDAMIFLLMIPFINIWLLFKLGFYKGIDSPNEYFDRDSSENA